jgi:hypothetical protein
VIFVSGKKTLSSCEMLILWLPTLRLLTATKYGLEFLGRHDEHRSICSCKHLERHIIGAEDGSGDRTVAADYEQVVIFGLL